MKEIKRIEKNLVKNAMTWDNLRERVQIKKGSYKGYEVYYNGWYIGCGQSMIEIHSILTMVNNMVIATR